MSDKSLPRGLERMEFTRPRSREGVPDRKVYSDRLPSASSLRRTRAASLGNTVRTDLDAIREHHRFLRDREQDAKSASGEVRLAARYDAKLHKEYALADLSRSHEGKVGLRWRTEREVVSGKGRFTCGAIACDETQGLRVMEVNFRYQEEGRPRNALVKLALCVSCTEKMERTRRGDHRAASSRRRKKRDRESSPGRSRSRERRRQEGR